MWHMAQESVLLAESPRSKKRRSPRRCIAVDPAIAGGTGGKPSGAFACSPASVAPNAHNAAASANAVTAREVVGRMSPRLASIARLGMRHGERARVVYQIVRTEKGGRVDFPRPSFGVDQKHLQHVIDDARAFSGRVGFEGDVLAHARQERREIALRTACQKSPWRQRPRVLG